MFELRVITAHGVKMSVHAIFLFVIGGFSLALAYETLNCSPANISIDFDLGKRINIHSPVMNLTYNRDTLAIYLYPDTPSVNIFVTESLISVKRNDVNDSSLGFINHEKQYTTEVTGIANIANISNYNVSLRDCKFFVSDKLTGRFYNELPTKLEATIYHVVEQCLTEKLCRSLGSIRYDDMVRAKMSPRHFGPVSIWSKNLQTRFPKMVPPKLANNNELKKRTNLVEAADTIVRLVADGFRLSSNGVMKIPDANHGLYSASKGKFSGLNRLVRAENYIVKVSPQTHNPRLFSFTFSIPEGHVFYEDYHAFSLIPLIGNLCADVTDVLFNAVVSMDFNQNSCHAKLQNFWITSKGNSKTYTCGSLSFLTNPILRWFVNAWDDKILMAIAEQVQWTMSAYVNDKFDCESFRPT